MRPPGAADSATAQAIAGANARPGTARRGGSPSGEPASGTDRGQMPVRGSVALVTGASSGIGQATARALADAGAHVLVHGRDREALSALAKQIGARPLPADLADPAEVRRLAQCALDVDGRVDILVANAGVGWAGRFAQMPAEKAGRLVEVNLTAPIRLARALMPAMLERDRGFLAFVSSIAGRTGVAGEAVYAATKAGLDAFAESIRLELRGTGIGVGVIVPGPVETRFFERRGQPYRRSLPRPMPPERVATALVRMIDRGGAEQYRPRWLRVPVAVRVLAPALYRHLARRYGGS
ncbi:MAG TPA: SDR family NAD(P)-dependent oxidoreductase [Micromonosporaceae bacterium]